MRSSSDTAIVSRRQTRDKTINNGNEAVVRCRGVRIRFLWTRSRTNLKTNVHVQRAESSCCFTNINRTGIPRNVLFRQKTGGDMLSICLSVRLSVWQWWMETTAACRPTRNPRLWIGSRLVLYIHQMNRVNFCSDFITTSAARFLCCTFFRAIAMSGSTPYG